MKVLKNIILIFVLILSVSSNILLAQKSKSSSDLQSIKYEDILQTIGYLSSAKFKGRLPGTAEYDQAARYVATRLKSAGVKPINQPSMLQYFNDEVNIIKDAQLLLLNEGTKSFQIFKLGEDFVCRGFSGSGNIKAEVVFAGFGIRTDEYNDYRSIDVKGKIVLVYKSAPPWDPTTGSWGDTSPRAKARIAKELGAKAIIFMADPKIFPSTMIYGSIACGEGPHLPDFPMIQIGSSVTDSIFAKLSMKPMEYYEQIVKDKAPHSTETEQLLMININADYTPEKQTANVVGFIEGTDSKLKSEFIILGAHLDHVGYQTENVLFPGANDNASGVASLISIADALHKSGVKLKRSVIFVAFSSEESGLKGSKYFVNNSPVDLSKAVAMMNFDCVGQGDSININGKLSFPKLWKKAKKIDKKHIKLLSNRSFGGGGGDATAFYNANIPTLYFSATNGYKFIHQTTDKAETINNQLVEKITKLGFLMTIELANGKYEGETDKLKKQ
ncbi:MAG: M20/M25/M40 family metallo-hydrolase [Bacteroidales bacterium]